MNGNIPCVVGYIVIALIVSIWEWFHSDLLLVGTTYALEK